MLTEYFCSRGITASVAVALRNGKWTSQYSANTCVGFECVSFSISDGHVTDFRKQLTFANNKTFLIDVS